LVYLAFLFYMLRRILGADIIPQLNKADTYTQDYNRGHVSNDEYRYKEWLYKHKK